MMAMASMASVTLLFLLRLRSGIQQPPFDHCILHHLFILLLFLPLDRQQRVLPYFGLRVPHGIRSVRLLLLQESLLHACILLQFVIVVTLDQVINPTVSEKVGLHFIGCAGHTSGRSLVHKFDSVNDWFSAGCFLNFAELEKLPLFFTLFAPLFNPFALVEGGALLFPDAFLVLKEMGMPGFFEVKILAKC